MSDHTQRFTGKAEKYAAFRERFDAEIVLPLLRAWTGLTPEWRVADVGAGTGMLADVFLENGNCVVAVEPNAEMREVCARLHADEPRLEIVDGTAERTGLADASVDMVVVGRAFHWFDVDAAMTEFRRVLKPDGWVSVISFGRMDDGPAENVALEALLLQYGPGIGTTRAYYDKYRQFAPCFADGEYFEERRAGAMSLGWDELLGLMLSISHAPLPGSERFEAFVEDLRLIFDRFAEDGVMRVATQYWLNVGRFAGETAA